MGASTACVANHPVPMCPATIIGNGVTACYCGDDATGKAGEHCNAVAFNAVLSKKCIDKSINILSATCQCGTKNDARANYGDACVGNLISTKICANDTDTLCHCGA